jgi:predicted aspartyl protease
MGTFSVACRVANIIDRSQSVELDRLQVDTGSEYTWIAGELLEQINVDREKKDLQFVMANGTLVTRSVGFAILHVENAFITIDEVVFAAPGDLLHLGARTLEGLNLTVDSGLQTLVAVGPLPAA